MCLGIPAQLVEITDASALTGVVSVGGVRREVNLACVVDDAHPLESLLGGWILVHVGFALVRVDKQAAAETLALLREGVERSRGPA